MVVFWVLGTQRSAIWQKTQIFLKGEKIMGYLAYVISGIWMLTQNTAELSTNQAVKMFLDHAVGVAGVFFFIVLAIYLVVGALAILFGVSIDSYAGVLAGCNVILATLFPIAAGLVWWMSSVLANSFSATAGIVDPVKFWIALAIIVVSGLG